MRTEDELRDALTTEPGRERVERMAQGILAQTAAPQRRRRPLVVGLAVALTLAVVVGFAVTNLPRSATPADPPTPTPSRAVHTEATWRMVHRVDPPEGWTVVLRSVQATVESTEVMRADGVGCDVDVFGRGTRPTPVSSDAPPSTEPAEATVQGTNAYWDGYRTLGWSYQEDATAQVTCVEGGLELARTIAERVVFEPAVVRLPLRLGQVPEGYRPGYVAEEGKAGSVLLLAPIDPDPAWEIEFLVAEKTPDPTPPYRPPGLEQTTIAGLPAQLDPGSGSLELDADPYRIQIHFAYGQDSEHWAAGRREQLVQLAESLELAPDLGDRETWFDAEEALPD